MTAAMRSTPLIRSELGWNPRHTFEQGLESTVRWFLTILTGAKQPNKARANSNAHSQRLRSGEEKSSVVGSATRSTELHNLQIRLYKKAAT